MSERRRFQKRNAVANDTQSATTLERITGVEPAYAAWEAAVLPMNYIRICWVLYQSPRRIATRNPATHSLKIVSVSPDKGPFIAGFSG